MSDLDKLGHRHRELLTELAELKDPLQAAMRAERDTGATYADLVERTGYRTIQQVREICMTDEQRAAERAKRRRRDGHGYRDCPDPGTCPTHKMNVV